MNKTIRLYSIIFMLAIGALYLYEYSKPKPINWYPSFAKKHKIPYGTYILYDALPDLFPNTEIKETHLPTFEFLDDTLVSGTLFLINNKIDIDDATLNRLLDFVSRGNTVFASASGYTIDTLNIKSKRLFKNDVDNQLIYKLYSPSFKNREYTFKAKMDQSIFSSIDTTNTKILGLSAYVSKNGERSAYGANFIEVKFGKGKFLLHNAPEVFTNYGILEKPIDQYAAGVLSYLADAKNIIWDAYHKSGKSSISSPMHYILTNRSLKWAYFIMLFGLLFYVIFEGKRKQRSIPVLKELKNQSLAFTRTIGNMYYEKQDHYSIAQHQIRYFMDHIRTTYRIKTNAFDNQFYQDLTARSGKVLTDIKKLFKLIQSLQQKNRITADELKNLNQQIEKFKQ